MVDEGLSVGMAEWVTGHAMRHHLDMDLDILRGRATGRRMSRRWPGNAPSPSSGWASWGRRRHGCSGRLGFPVTGWSRTPKAVDGITCLSGEDGLGAALETAQILVLLLPDTPATRNILNADTLAHGCPAAR